MSSIYHLLNQLSPDSNTKGKQFEKITQWFLQNEPKWQAKIEKVWLWDDYPRQVGRRQRHRPSLSIQGRHTVGSASKTPIN
jgi:predicted helicase